jgi:hypothetical protein
MQISGIINERDIEKKLLFGNRSYGNIFTENYISELLNGMEKNKDYP